MHYTSQITIRLQNNYATDATVFYYTVENDKPMLRTLNFQTFGGLAVDMYTGLVCNETAMSYGGADI